MKFHIYVFTDSKGRPYYVGRTNNVTRRRKEHLDEIRKGNTLPKYRMARKLMKQGYKFRMKTIAKTLSLKDSMELEKFFIKRYRSLGYTLYNLTSGGDDKQKIKINYKKKKKLYGKKVKVRKKRR
jgi:predicted GIY-YIG superfamily endonuclease